MHFIVIGAGIIGVTTAYYLRRSGFDVTVVERREGVAQEASYANAGVIAPAYVAPWAQPGMLAKVLRGFFQREAPVVFRPQFDRALWRWLWTWFRECDPERFRRNKSRMLRLATYSRDQLHIVRERHSFSYEQSQSFLQLFRSEADLERNAPARRMLVEAGVPHELLDAVQCRSVEPALHDGTRLAGGLLLLEDETGNCAHFARLLKQVCSADGVVFRFNAAVDGLVREGDSVHAVRIGGESLAADAVIVAAGADSAQLLAPFGIKPPLYPMKGYSATVAINRHEHAPVLSVMDETYKVAITRLGNRLRIAGTAEVGSRRLFVRASALRTLLKVASDWFPHAASYAQATYWVGARPMLADGPPVLGRTRVRNLFVNLGHGSSGWAMACGSARIVADIVSGRTPEIDMEGLTLDRYGAD